MNFLRALLQLVLFFGATFCIWVLMCHLTDTSELQEGDDNGKDQYTTN